MEPEGKLSELARAAMGPMASGNARAYINSKLREPHESGGLMALIATLAAAVEEQEQEVKMLAEKLAPMLCAQVPDKASPSRAIPTTTSAAGQHLTSIYNQLTNNTDNLRAIRFAIET